MQKYKSNLTTASGSAVRGANITVLDSTGALASIYLDKNGTVPSANPVTTGNDGTFSFYAANGRYSLRTDSAGANVLEEDVILLNDPVERYAGLATDSELRDRATHTGKQAIDTVTGLQDAIDALVGKSGAQVMTGDLTVPSINGGQLAGTRNKVINGAFQVNQRTYVSGAATTAGQYTLDRWKVTGTGGVSFSTTAGKTTVTIPAGQTLQQVIEGLDLQSGTYVLSWEGTAQGRVGAGAYGASGAVTAAITGGTNTIIEFNAGTVANVQFEPGTIATPFENRSYGLELALGQRYYETGYFDLRCYSQYGTSNRVSFAVVKRAAPTLTMSDIDYGGTGAVVAYADSPTIDSFRAGADWTSTPAWRSVGFRWEADSEL